MPMGTTSYLRLSMALRMEAAERSETSCSPERPPKRMPMRSFFFMTFPVSDSGLWFVGGEGEKNHGGYRFLLLGRVPLPLLPSLSPLIDCIYELWWGQILPNKWVTGKFVQTIGLWVDSPP